MTDLIERSRKEVTMLNGYYRMPKAAAVMSELITALEAAREDVKAVGTVLGGEFHYLRPSHGLPDGTMLYAIDQARRKGA